MDRPLENEDECVQLFAKNLDVDLFNYAQIQKIEGELKVYRAFDEGSQEYLDKFLAPKNLGLKVNCPVMLVKNLSDTLVNGLRGTVIQMNDNSVDVKFEFERKTLTVNVSPTSFTTFDPVDKVIIAKRVQLPLKVAYAITIHKSQGMTLEKVVVNCQNIMQPGQLGVAVGRATSVSGLKVVKFQKHFCKKHPASVLNFYKTVSVGDFKDDLTCCKLRVNVEITPESENESDDGGDSDSTIAFWTNEDSDFSESEIEKLEFLDSVFDNGQDIFPNEPLPSKQTLENVLQDFTDTPVEKQCVDFKTAIMNNYKPFDEWFQKQSSVMEDIGLNCFPEEVVSFSQKHRNDFFLNLIRI